MPHFTVIDWLGALGGVALLFAFWRTSIGKWTGKSLWYELDNLVAAACLVTYSLNKGAYVSVVVNAVWGVVAFRGVSSWAERRMQRKRAKTTR